MPEMPGASGFFSQIVLLYRFIVETGWQTVATIFDLGRHISPTAAAGLIVGIGAFAFAIAGLMQRRLTRKLVANPKGSVSILRQELRFSLPAMLVFVAALPVLMVVRAVRALGNFFSSLIGPGREGKAGATAEEKKEDPSIVVATLGPSFMWAGLIVAGIFVLSWLIEPLLRYQLDLNAGTPAWQYLILGARPEMQWYLPLERFDYFGLLVVLALWMGIWWWAARIVRVVLGSNLGQNLAGRAASREVLASWRTWFGARRLFEADASYKAWAIWPLVAALPFLAWAFGTVSAEPYRTDSSLFAVSVVLWLSWAIHLNLSGHWYMSAPEPMPEPEVEPDPGKGWADILADLHARLQVDEPYTFEPPRRVEPLQIARHPADGGLISPLLAEIYPPAALRGEKTGPTHMQQTVLEALSRQAYVHVDPPARVESLELGRVSGAGVEDESGLRHRNQIVLAPDGSGKTTLAMLAACNHALTHTRATLVVTRDEQSAEQFTELMRATLEPSTLRWTVRVKRANAGLVSDLSQGIIPDVIVTSLRQLVVSILAEPQTYTPFLKTLGLVIIDDVESFCGPVEIHTQLAFRRLTLRVREILGTRQLGEASAPVTLILGGDSMHNTSTWVKALCGVDAVTRTFDYGINARKSGAAGSGVRALESAEPGRYQLFYQLSDFVSRTGDGVTVLDLIDSCERLGIPWHYRRCGDSNRGHGRRNLKLLQEPQYDVDAAQDACVVFLEGRVSTVRREIAHLNRAGLGYEPVAGQKSLAGPVPIALISIVDADERMALTELNPNSSLADIVRTLPRPVVRAPFGQAVEAHLAADLADTWLEVADILDVFGNTAVHTLARLAEAGLLLHESRTNLNEAQTAYEENLHVRVPLKAVAAADMAFEATRHLLPPRVAQVERPPGPSVAVRDRTNLTVLARTDRVSARHLYYPGRIFKTAQGRYVVVGAASSDAANAAKNSPVSAHDILVEPFLNDEISSPRRRTRVRPMAPSDTLPGAVATLAKNAESSGADIEAEPVFIGDFPVAFSLGPVLCTTRHLATFRLDAHTYQVRQRLLFGERTPSGDARGMVDTEETLRTVALGIFPNPSLDVVQRDDCPRLQLRDARLIAAAMRAVLPSMYRGMEVDIQVALHIAADTTRPDQELRADEGFYLYDPHLGGNGTAHAIHRDGVELLLRLCRVYLERVLYHDRLRARYDFWGDIDELRGLRGARHPDKASQGGQSPLTERERDQRARKRALTWLDSRLRPEGSAAGGKYRAQFGVGSEQGEGDIFDLGRCWFSADGSVTDLIWTKHRWTLYADTNSVSEAMCDIGIGRKIAARARSYSRETPQLREHLSWLKKQLENPAFRQEDQTVWGNPNPIWSLEAGEDMPSGSDTTWLKDDRLNALHRLVLAVVCENYACLGPLAELLAERSGVGLEEEVSPQGAGAKEVAVDQAQRRVELARFFADFVQGIPFAPREEPGKIYGPVHTLLYRLGNQQSQSLLLAILLRHAGVDSGLFLHPDTGRMLCAAALPDDASAESILRWRARFGRVDRRLIWGEFPPQPGVTTQMPQAFFPIETVRHEALAVADIQSPETWVFLPLSAAWLRVGVEKAAVPGGAR